MDYEQAMRELRQAYDLKVEERDQKQIDTWKTKLRAQFLKLLQSERKQSLLEIGAGTGIHGKFFQDNGLKVVCTDLSPAMVKRCQEKGLKAYVQDFLNLDFPTAAFDSVFAMNCLLHVPRTDLPMALATIRSVMKPNGLFFLGQYGGENWSGIFEGDHYKPKRFYSLLSDSAIEEVASELFTIEEFSQIVVDDNPRFNFQALTLRRAEPMKPRITVITLGVSDLEESLRFYRDGLGFPTEGIIGKEFEYGAVVFIQLQPGLRLALWPRESIAHDTGLTLSPSSPTEMTLGHNVSSKAEVDAVMAKAGVAGAVIVKPAHDTFWGGYSGYFQDPDGHLWEVVWNPQWSG